MIDLTNNFGTPSIPVKALLIYESASDRHNNNFYVESYDMDRDGCPINGHPLSVKEANSLAKSLLIAEKKQRNFLNPNGLLSANVIFLRTGNDGFAIWRTAPKKVNLLFSESLDIPCGEAQIPALLWNASKSQLRVFAIQDEVVTAETTLYHAPFFNVYAEGKVCMGNVGVKIPHDCPLERFMEFWEDYFFNSYFSHLFSGHTPVKGNIVQLWQSLVNSNLPFPSDCLIPNNILIQNLIK